MQNNHEKVAVPIQMSDARFWLAAIAESSEDAIVGKDVRGIVTSWNRAAETMFGYGANEIVGQPISWIIPQDRIAEEASILARVRSGERIAHFETERKRKDGTLISVSLTVSPIRDEEGRVIGASKIARDLTERQELERHAIELQAQLVHLARVTELGHMVSALAHEVNQPLTAVASYLGGLRRLITAGNIDRAQQVIGRMAIQCDRASQIILRLRDHVRKRATTRRRESLKEAIDEVRDFAIIGIARSLVLDIHVDESAPTAVIDKIEIQQVLLNLIRNAVEAMADLVRPEVSITTASAGDMVEISVADNGPGLSEAVQEHLFQSFFTTKLDGMGIGLSVCRTIVEAHGGKIRAESQLGHGTVFRFTVSRQ